MKIIPRNYERLLGVRETELAIKFVKDTFERTFAEVMNLERISAPMFVETGEGLNDDLNGVERPVRFDVAGKSCMVEVVHSLAKWKRMALKRYGYLPGEGIYTDMNAIRRDEELDNLHSIYVDQWDWERVITGELRNPDYLKSTVYDIVHALKQTEAQVCSAFDVIDPIINGDVFFITAEELRQLYPNKTPKQRENAIVRKYGTVFISNIGGPLGDGIPHDGRAPDYDDWKLNGDLLIYYPILDTAVELSSMGIRVNERSLLRQLDASGHMERASLPYHSALLSGQLPLTVGGGIGQSRLCMVLLHKAHIGEVQASIWDDATIRWCSENDIELL
ncbi:MAG: aspartate--ammonia ligase [Ruminococcaceae bacterium]|nr:aspartate--ammonia ligase [Oscillospiraceae bacterium]MBQ8898125.1 aspartate--ammonia ligase [Clostridia bacterium]